MDTQLKKGVLEMIVLHFLSKKNYYAYELNKALNTVIQTNESTSYAIFKKLIIKEYAEYYVEESQNGPSRKYYKITKDGLAELEKNKLEWSEFYQVINNLLNQ
ncbi:PadR family transcriptional regulator [Mesoplasma seiffertii]|uniref:PadR family transcriptional regulator n=1 Tax=Mesoplasma seiffertii TaxID=28224 RepID=UPI000478AD25|nr:PadR family transcriptional regulator [Mesoplasma seiffertii]